jgi:UDP-N-acetyl-D-glucosamine dehydrogenase
VKAELLQKISEQRAVVGVVGLGYVGLPLVVRLVEAGFCTVGFDIDPFKIDKLNKGETYIKHLSDDMIRGLRDSGRFSPTTDFSRISEADAILLCVPTPLGEHREPDLSYVINTTETIAPYLRPGQMVSLESTTYPGTTDEEIVPRVEQQGLKVGENAFVVFSPEREDPGNPNFTTRTIPKVVGGHTAACLEVGEALYGAIIDKIVPVRSTKAAEMTKLLENIYRAVNIGLVNELKIVADSMGIDIWEVIEAASTKPFGFTPFYPGPGLGGHCIPIDPFYLTWKAHEYGVHTRFIELAGDVNTAMPKWVISKIADALNDHGRSIKGSKILVLGIAYKKNIDDMRESPSVELMELLMEKGAEVEYADPYVPVFPKMRRYAFDLQSVEVTPENLGNFDCVLIATDHDAFDYEMIQKHSKIVVDTRGRYRDDHPNVFRS